MKNQLLEAPFVKEMIEVTTNSYRLGWNERNGGNVTYLIDEDILAPYKKSLEYRETVDLEFNVKDLENKYFLVTGSGRYFRNVQAQPTVCLGIVQVVNGGNSVDILWGLEGTKPTSELPSHLMIHMARLKVNPNNRIVMHNHATHLLAMTFSQKLEEKSFTKLLWQLCTECLVVFPDGVGIIPWIVPGTVEIGELTAKKMEESRLVLWPYHGVYGVGETMDEVFGLIETAEKAAEVYTYIQAQGGMIGKISDEELAELAVAFKVVPRPGILGGDK